MIINSLEGRQIAHSIRVTVAAALYEAKVKDDEILRLLQKYCNIDAEEAEKIVCNEKYIEAPCRELRQYLLLEKGYSPHDADVFIHNSARSALANNIELRKLSPTKLFDAIQRKK